MSKDRMAFIEGFTYRWQNPHQGRGPKKSSITKHTGNDFEITEDDTESNSSVSVLSSQPFNPILTQDHVSGTMVVGTIHPIQENAPLVLITLLVITLK